MRHVSRTHRVALDWLLDRINLDPKIQNKYVDTKTTNLQTFRQKRNFTRVEWNNLLHLFNIKPFQLYLLHQEFQLDRLRRKVRGYSRLFVQTLDGETGGRWKGGQ